MGITLNHFMNKFEEFKTLPSGESFTIRVTDQEATQVAREYLADNKESVGKKIQNRIGLSLKIEDPSVKFHNDALSATLTAGKGFLKAKASLTADVRWDGKPIVHVRSVDVPFISISPEKLNSVVEGPLKRLTQKVEEYAEIRSFKLTDGMATLEAVRK